MKIIVIGGGPGGYVAALRGAKKGAEVTLIEKDLLGGTCLNRGCIPTKAILHTANLYHETKHFASYGIQLQGAQLDFNQLMEHKEKTVSQLRNGVQFLLKKAGVTVVQGEARFVSKKCVAVGDTEYAGDYIIIATGSKPADIPIAQADGETILNSDHALNLKELPKSLAILGGGVIGCEFAQAFSRMGCKVTIVEMLPNLVANMDGDQSSLLQKVFKREGIDVFLNASVTKIQRGEQGISVDYTLSDGTEQKVCAEKLLLAAGRKPLTQGLALDSAGVTTAKNGSIPVNSSLETNVQGIYAIGDVNGGVQLAHVASHQGMIAVDNIFGEGKTFDDIAIPYCVYTSPELASIGKTQRDAEGASVGMFPVSANGRAMIEGAKEGFSKVIAKDDTILGIHLAGPNVTEMVSPLGGIIQFEATTEDVHNFIFAHPSVSEIVHESILDIHQMAIHKG